MGARSRLSASGGSFEALSATTGGDGGDGACAPREPGIRQQLSRMIAESFQSALCPEIVPGNMILQPKYGKTRALGVFTLNLGLGRCPMGSQSSLETAFKLGSHAQRLEMVRAEG
jgi:hypothetical protein